MPEYLQIEGDPTKWLLPQPFQTGQLTDQPLKLMLSAPVIGFLVLSARHHSITVSGQVSDDQMPNELNVPNQSIYLPTPHGISEGHVGHELPASADLENLADQIVAAMRDGHRQTITLNSGTLVLNGATLPFAVVCMQYPPDAGGPMPHD
jgi:hypothetical protein